MATNELLKNLFYNSSNILKDLANYLESQIKYVPYLDDDKVDDVINIDEIQRYFNNQVKKVRNKIKIITEELNSIKRWEER